jgi:hypothetical protein
MGRRSSGGPSRKRNPKRENVRRSGQDEARGLAPPIDGELDGREQGGSLLDLIEDDGTAEGGDESRGISRGGGQGGRVVKRQDPRASAIGHKPAQRGLAGLARPHYQHHGGVGKGGLQRGAMCRSKSPEAFITDASGSCPGSKVAHPFGNAGIQRPRFR